MTWESLFARVDRIAGGRHWAVRVGDAVRTDPRVVRTFRAVGWLLVVELLLGSGAVGEAVEVTATGGDLSRVVWWRLLVILGIASTLFYFLLRARAGWYWAYSRLRLFSIVFPVIAVTTCLIPGLYPGWMIAEQLLFSVVLLVIWWLLSRDPVRSGYARARSAGH